MAICLQHHISNFHTASHLSFRSLAFWYMNNSWGCLDWFRVVLGCGRFKIFFVQEKVTPFSECHFFQNFTVLPQGDQWLGLKDRLTDIKYVSILFILFVQFGSTAAQFLSAYTNVCFLSQNWICFILALSCFRPPRGHDVTAVSIVYYTHSLRYHIYCWKKRTGAPSITCICWVRGLHIVGNEKAYKFYLGHTLK